MLSFSMALSTIDALRRKWQGTESCLSNRAAAVNTGSVGASVDSTQSQFDFVNVMLCKVTERAEDFVIGM